MNFPFDWIAPGEYRYCSCGIRLVPHGTTMCAHCLYKPRLEDYVCWCGKPAAMMDVFGFRCADHFGVVKTLPKVDVNGPLDLLAWEKATAPLRPLRDEVQITEIQKIVYRDCTYEILERIGDTIYKRTKRRLFAGDKQSYGYLVEENSEGVSEYYIGDRITITLGRLRADFNHHQEEKDACDVEHARLEAERNALAEQRRKDGIVPLFWMRKENE